MTRSGKFTLDIDPAKIATAQQKGIDFDRRRVYTKRKLRSANRAIITLTRVWMQRPESLWPRHSTPATLKLAFFYAIPKTRLVRHGKLPALSDGQPCTAAWAGDLDNKAKAVIDAMVQAGIFRDDRDITVLTLAKAYTAGNPRIEVEVGKAAEP